MTRKRIAVGALSSVYGSGERAGIVRTVFTGDRRVDADLLYYPLTKTPFNNLLQLTAANKDDLEKQTGVRFSLGDGGSPICAGRVINNVGIWVYDTNEYSTDYSKSEGILRVFGPLKVADTLSLGDVILELCGAIETMGLPIAHQRFVQFRSKQASVPRDLFNHQSLRGFLLHEEGAVPKAELEDMKAYTTPAALDGLRACPAC